jgi:hypothetical protein
LAVAGSVRCGNAIRFFPAFKAAVRQSSAEKTYEEIDMLFETKDDCVVKTRRNNSRCARLNL